MSATDAPACLPSATIRRFSSSDHTRRDRLLPNPAASIVPAVALTTRVPLPAAFVSIFSADGHYPALTTPRGAFTNRLCSGRRPSADAYGGAAGRHARHQRG